MLYITDGDGLAVGMLQKDHDILENLKWRLAKFRSRGGSCTDQLQVRLHGVTRIVVDHGRYTLDTSTAGETPEIGVSCGSLVNNDCCGCFGKATQKMLAGEAEMEPVVSTDLFQASEVKCCRIISMEIRNLSWL